MHSTVIRWNGSNPLGGTTIATFGGRSGEVRRQLGVTRCFRSSPAITEARVIAGMFGFRFGFRFGFWRAAHRPGENRFQIFKVGNRNFEGGSDF